jgi:hypothetical protein
MKLLQISLVLISIIQAWSRKSPVKQNLRKPDRKIMLRSIDEPLIFKSESVIKRDQAKYKFNQFCEVFNGRLAMTGFAIGILKEEITGETFMEQLGLNSHDDQIKMLCSLVIISALAGLSRVFILNKK